MGFEKSKKIREKLFKRCLFKTYFQFFEFLEDVFSKDIFNIIFQSFRKCFLKRYYQFFEFLESVSSKNTFNIK